MCDVIGPIQLRQYDGTPSLWDSEPAMQYAAAAAAAAAGQQPAQTSAAAAPQVLTCTSRLSGGALTVCEQVADAAPAPPTSGDNRKYPSRGTAASGEG